MGSNVEWVITVDKNDLMEEDIEQLSAMIENGAVEDHKSNREFIAAIRDNHPGTSLCSGVEAVGLVAGVITIYSASRDAYDKITRKLDENEIEYTDMTDDVIEADNNDT